MFIQPLEWDSSFFNLRIGKAVIRTSDGLEELRNVKGCLRERYDLIYLFIDNPDLYFEDKDAFLADQKTVYIRYLTDGSRPSAHIRPFQESRPNSALYRLAFRSGVYSRFNTDPSFPKGGFEALYRRWIEQAVEDRHCAVLCYFEADIIVGMLTLVIDEESGLARIGLTAVDAEYSGRGIGSSLIESACWYLYGKGIKRFETVTQRQNVSACRWYEKNGFHLESISNIYHWWLNCSNHEDSF